jgi:hypothetical protein
MYKPIKNAINLAYQLKIDRGSNAKIKMIKRNIDTIQNIDQKTLNEYINRWSIFGKRPSVDFLKCMCSLSGITSDLFIPENIHYGFIEPVLNNRAFSLIFNDKNFYERYLSDFRYLFPKAILRGINGILHDSNFEPVSNHETSQIISKFEPGKQLILKPAIETGGGLGVNLLSKSHDGFVINNVSYSNEDVLKFMSTYYKNSFILQERIQQNEMLSDFNETSNNVIRVYTYRSVTDNSIKILHAYLRFGKPGSIVDGLRGGGATIGITMAGIFNDFALSRYGVKKVDLKAVAKYSNKKVQEFENIKTTAANVAGLFPYHRLLGFDFTIDRDNKLKLFEVNNMYIGIINQQMNTGPLFGEYTDDVIDYYRSHKKSFAFHFYI